MKGFRYFKIRLEQPHDLSAFQDVDLVGGRDLGQARHPHDLSGQGHQEPGAGGQLHFPDRDLEARGAPQLLGVVAEGVLGLGHADGQVPKAGLLQGVELVASLRDDLGKRRGTGFVDWTDAVYRDNHIANRITFPNGERYVIDYWESAASGKPEVIPEKEWVQKWQKKLAYDAVVQQSDQMDQRKSFIDNYKQSRGNTLQAEHQALQDYQKAHPGERTVETLARSWRDRPW